MMCIELPNKGGGRLTVLQAADLALDLWVKVALCGGAVLSPYASIPLPIVGLPFA